MAQALVAVSTCASVPNASSTKHWRSAAVARPSALQIRSRITASAALFKQGTPLYFRSRKSKCQAISITTRCEQGTKQASNGLDVWLGRLAMVGFATAITVEVVTGKGLLENFGFATPLPTLALAVTALVGILTAFFIFQSTSQRLNE